MDTNPQNIKETYFKYYRIKRSIAFMEQYDSWKSWVELKERMRRRRMHRIVKSISVAASVVVFLIGAYFYSASVLKSQESVIRMADSSFSFPEVKKNEILLTFDDGGRVNLTEQSGRLDRSGELTEISNVNNQLVYKPVQTTSAKISYNTLSVPRGGEYQLILSDGTKVWVNAESSIKYPVCFGEKERVIYAVGEIYLEVAKDSLRPFQVVTNDLKVEVLGTSFNVNAYPDEDHTTVTLVNGRVAAYIHTNSYRLSPGEQLVMNSSDHKTMVRTVDTDNVIAWKNGIYIFKGQTLEEVGRILNRWYDIEFVFDNVLVQQTKYTGVVKKEENIDSFIRVVNEISNFKCQLIGKTLYIK